MAKVYKIYNDAQTINVEYVTDGLLNHETVHVTDIRGLDSVDIQAGIDFKILPYTEYQFEKFAKDNYLNLAIYNDGSLVSDVSGGAAITAYEFADVTETSVVIDHTALTIEVLVPYGTTVTALVANFTLSANATAKIGATAQVTGVTANNFTSPKTYVVTAESGATKSYVVTVTEAANPAKAITGFNFAGLSPEVIGIVDEGNKTIALTVPNGTDVTELVPTITHTGASISPNTGVAQNFTNPVTYTVTAANATTQKYVVTVTID